MQPTITRRLFSSAAVLGAVALIGAGCGDDNGSTNGSTTRDTTTTSASQDANAGAVSTMSAAADLRLTMDRLLGEHAMLAQFATQKGLKGDKDFKAIAGALDENSVELSEAIGSIYGEEAGKKFLDGDLLWRDHINFFVDYTTGLATKDQAKQKKAVGDLTGYVAAQSAFLSDATGIPQDALESELTKHVTQLKSQIDAYAAGNYEKAYDEERMAFHHMVETGDTLAGAIADQKSEQFDQGNATQSAVDLRATMGTLLGEHTMLAQIATQKGYDGDPDFKAIAAALDKNSVELSEAIGSVYGEEAGKQFLDGDNLWRDHINYFVDYTTGLAKKDKAMQDEAVGNLQAYVAAQSSFLAEATGLPQEALQDAISEHVTQLKNQIDAYAAGDYTKAYSTAREAYEHMYMTADTLAEAMVKQSPDKFDS